MLQINFEIGNLYSVHLSVVLPGEHPGLPVFTGIPYRDALDGLLTELFSCLYKGKRVKKTVAFPFQVSYKVHASEDVPLARIKGCILRKSIRVSQKVPGFMSGTFFIDPGAVPGRQTQNKELVKWQREQ